MKRKVLAVGMAFSFVAVLACGLLYGVTSSVQGQAVATNALQLEGTWLVTVTPPPGGPPQYISLGSYMNGGVLITSPDPSVGPSVTSPGQGTWIRTGGNEFASAHVAFTYDAGGNISGAIRIKASYQLTGKDRFEGNGQLQFCDTSLSNCFTPPGCPVLASVLGQRIVAEPPSCPAQP